MSIEVKNVTKIFGKQKALDDVSFEIKSGEIVGFLGPNGAGKSTMMKIITGFIPQTSGQVLVNGIDTDEDPISISKKLGYLPESNPLYYDMYIREYLYYVAGIYGLGKESKKVVEDIIERTGLTFEIKKRIGALSKGYKQRVGLAQALMHNPEVLILDEPTSGLDPNQIIEIRNLITEVGKKKTVMLSTHIMQEVEAICDRIIIIKNGKIVANDSIGNMQKYNEEAFQTVVVEFNKAVLENDLKALNHVNKVARIDDCNWLVQSDNQQDIREVLFQFAVQKSIAVLSMQKKEKSLEQVFQELTK